MHGHKLCILLEQGEGGGGQMSVIVNRAKALHRAGGSVVESSCVIIHCFVASCCAVTILWCSYIVLLFIRYNGSTRFDSITCYGVYILFGMILQHDVTVCCGVMRQDVF